MANPFPQLQSYQATSGLSFRWAEYHPDPGTGGLSATLGPDGVSATMRMLIYWNDLNIACKELLGYSWREVDSGVATLRRKLPWQHPIWNQLYVKRIADVKGIRAEGKSSTDPEDDWSPSGSGIGAGAAPNLGPRSEFRLAELTIQFWRPPYFVRSDADIVDPFDGDQQEWLRYVSKTWEMSLNMLSRENSTFQWLPGLKHPSASANFTGSVGQTLSHFRVTRTWYQIPEQALFNTLVDSTPNGLPTNMVYTQTPTENPISKFDQAVKTTVTTAPALASLLAANGYTYAAGSPIGGCVNAPIGGKAVDLAGNWVDSTLASRFFGCYSGTLRFDGVTFTPQPLQLPPQLMEIPLFSGNEPIAQTQYDVTFHFDLFDPPPGTSVKGAVAAGAPIRGHNLFPFSGNGLWYPLLSQNDATTGTSGAKLTPFQYADFTDLFTIL